MNLRSRKPRGLSRRQFLKTAGLGTAALAVSGPGIACRKGPLSRGGHPNLVYLFADQLHYQSLGYAGDRKARTPNIDWLASRGANYANAVSNTPVCAPYRASLLTGKYASSTGMVINELRMNPNHRCFGHILTENGYETGYIGKWHLWANEAGNHDDPKNARIPPGKYRLGFDGFWAAYNFNHNYYKAAYYKDSPEKIQVNGYEPDIQTDLAISFLKEKAASKKPFALFVSYGPPHDPWEKDNVPESFYKTFADVEFSLPPTWSDHPDPYMDRFTDPVRWLEYYKPSMPEFQRVYYAMTANLDWNIGRILEALEKAGVADDTIIVFTSDHGEMFGAHGRVQKLTFYEEAVRVPFLVRWPDRIPSGLVSYSCLGTPDIMPTVLGLMRLPIPDDVEGMDLSRLALGKKGPEPEAAFLQGMGHTYLWIDGFEWRALRDKRYTYAVYRRDGSELLFDHVADPFQTQNLAGSPEFQKIADKFRDDLKLRMEGLTDNFELCTWYRDHWTDGDRNILRGARG
jgi:arylsulfatase A-like enzyme